MEIGPFDALCRKRLRSYGDFFVEVSLHASSLVPQLPAYDSRHVGDQLLRGPLHSLQHHLRQKGFRCAEADGTRSGGPESGTLLSET